MRKSLGDFRASHARLDPVIPQCGLFRVLPDRRPETATDGGHVLMERATVIHEYRFAGRLGPVEWRTFLVVCALAGLDGERVIIPTDSAVVAGTEPTGGASNAPSIRFRVTMYALLNEIGLGDCGRTRRRLVESLKRLASVRLFLSKGTRTISAANLLSFASDESTGELAIGLSPQVAAPILGEARQYTQVSLAEVRALIAPAAIILHAALSARLNHGEACRYAVDTLADLAYGVTSDDATRRKRRGRIRAAVGELGRLPGWNVMVVGRVATIQRGKRRTCDPSRIAVQPVTLGRATCHADNSSNPGGPSSSDDLPL